MDTSKFYLTPEEIYDSFDSWDESDERYEKVTIASANHAIKTLVEWIEGHGYKQFATDADLHLNHLDHKELLKLEEDM